MMLAIVAGLVVALVLVIVIFGRGASRDSGPVSDFPIEDYMARGSQLRDNTYRLSGRVEERITRGNGDLVTLVVKKQSGPEERLPVIVPQEAKTINIEREQEYHFKVKVVNRGNEKGLLIAQSVSEAR